MTDAADKAVADDERSMALLEERLRQERIKESMRPYKPNPHRRCEDCEEPIGAERLKLQPHTGRCANCATAAEQRFARMPFA